MDSLRMPNAPSRKQTVTALLTHIFVGGVNVCVSSSTLSFDVEQQVSSGFPLPFSLYLKLAIMINYKISPFNRMGVVRKPPNMFVIIKGIVCYSQFCAHLY